jgi:hypothetical protein
MGFAKLNPSYGLKKISTPFGLAMTEKIALDNHSSPASSPEGRGVI